jgi:hypothetical protein
MKAMRHFHYECSLHLDYKAPCRERKCPADLPTEVFGGRTGDAYPEQFLASSKMFKFAGSKIDGLIMCHGTDN